MNMGLVVELVLLVVVIIQFVVMIKLFSKNREGSQADVSQRLAEYSQRLDKNESTLRDEFSRNREETDKAAGRAREELSSKITDLTKIVDGKMESIQKSQGNELKTNREELKTSISAFEKKVTDTISKFSETLNKELKDVQDRVYNSTKDSREELSTSLEKFEKKSSEKIEALTKDTKDGLEKNRDSVEKKLTAIQQGNEKKLDEMRQTVDEKLQKTLETRLGESFKLVSERLELVQKGLGEMQTLVSDVGNLKNVLSNVKTKGMLGEYQLGAILEQILTPDQYAQNVKTKENSGENVEFAVKIPSKEDSNKIIWLPIDAKFPTADYEVLLAAYESGEKEKVEQAQKDLKTKIEKFAKDIHEKYIDPPNTTEFGIMFLPFEGLYAEVLRIPGLFEHIQYTHKITITGPTTISAFLNSLQMGFRSLAVQKRTSEMWDLLRKVKKGFGEFGEVLERTKKKLVSASKDIDGAGIKSKKIVSELSKVETIEVQTLPEDKAQKLLSDIDINYEEVDINYEESDI